MREMEIVAFGPFEWDSAASELRRNGVRVRLSGQPAEILKLLLVEPGRLVTRDDLRRTLWGEDTFVDFEQGLNTAVARLRQGLGDSAEAPRFVETVPGQGYRFIGRVELRSVEPRTPTAPDRRLGRREWVAGGLGTMAGAAAAYLFGALRLPETDPRRGRFVLSAPPALPVQLSPFTNVAIAPDGQTVVYACNREGSPGLYLRSIHETEGRFLSGSDVYNPFSRRTEWRSDTTDSPTRPSCAYRVSAGFRPSSPPASASSMAQVGRRAAISSLPRGSRTPA